MKLVTSELAKKSRHRCIGTATVAALLLTGCGSPSEGGQASGGETLDVLIPMQLALLEPERTAERGFAPILLAMEPLMSYDTAAGELVPKLAETMETPDNLHYVFTIREGVQFWDGTPLTMEDVKYSFDMHFGEETESLNAQLFSDVESVDITGENQVTVTMRAPDSQFELAIPQTPIVSQAFYEEHGDQVGTPEVLNMGTGPYKFDAFTPSAETKLVANEAYWGDQPRYDAITLTTVSEDSRRLLAIQSGEYDAVFGIPLGQLQSFEAIDGINIASGDDLMIYRVNFDVTKAPWNEIELRRAVVHATDREAIVAAALAGRATLTPTITPAAYLERLLPADEVTAAYDGFAADLTYDVEAARAALARSSVAEGLTIDVPVTASDPNLGLIGQMLSQNLAEIGIELNIVEVDDPTYFDAVYYEHSSAGLTIDGLSGVVPDPAHLPRFGYGTGTTLKANGSGVNASEYSNPVVDEIIARSQALAADDPERGRLILEALATAQTDVPAVPIAFPQTFTGAVNGYRVENFDTFWWMSDWTEEILVK